MHRETFSFVMRLSSNVLRVRPDGGWVYPKCANIMAVSGLSCRKALFGVNGLGNQAISPVGPVHLLRQVGVSRDLI